MRTTARLGQGWALQPETTGIKNLIYSFLCFKSVVIMKKLLACPLAGISFAAVAQAADVGMPPVYDWTGLYVGLNGGAAINNTASRNVSHDADWLCTMRF